MLAHEGLQRGLVFLDKCLVGRANRILTGGLLDGSSVLLDFQSFPVIRFVAHNDDIAFETGNVFRDERLVRRGNENLITERVNGR
jgi:hypothetical protein